jgi:hypothetical protein
MFWVLKILLFSALLEKSTIKLCLLLLQNRDKYSNDILIDKIILEIFLKKYQKIEEKIYGLP